MFMSLVNRPVELSLRLIGVWPNTSYAILKRFIWVITLLTFETLQYWYLFTHLALDDLPEWLDCLSLVCSNTLVFLKLIIIWYHTGLIHSILNMMTEDWASSAANSWALEAVKRKAALARQFSQFIVVIYLTCSFLYGLSNSLSKIDTNKDSNLNIRKPVIKMEFPFDTTTSPVYEIITIVQIIFETIVASMAGMILALSVTLILHACGQIDIICKGFEELQNHGDGIESKALVLKDLVRKHQRIICLADDIDDLFSYMSFLQFLTNTIVICFLAFVLVTSLDSPERSAIFVKSIPYYIVVNFEAFILCYSGEYLSTESARIRQSAYDSPWYQLNSREIRTLTFLILRSQKQMTLTVGKFMTLSLDSFTTILKTSASYVSVLHAMYQ